MLRTSWVWAGSTIPQAPKERRFVAWGVSGYFDLEKPRFALDQGPGWLKIDEATGVLSGTPDAISKVEVRYYWD